MRFLQHSLVALFVAGLAVVNSANGALIQFNLQGTAGLGLLSGNEPGAIVGGSGGEIGSGITFDNVTNILAINVGWGSGNGFTDLSSNVSNQHIHGPTASNNGLGFTQTTGVLFTLVRSSNSPVNGQILSTTAGNSPVLSAAQITDLFNVKYYVNVHTANNGGGEIRGFLVPLSPVPEPGSAALLLVGGLFGLTRFRNRNVRG